MEIVTIFAPNLYAIKYDGNDDNEYERMMDLWTDVSYLRSYAAENNVSDIDKFVETILENGEQIQDLLDNLRQKNQPYGLYFESLQDSEHAKILSLQKGKIKQNILRYYAIKIDDDCFLITGGAIKMSWKMQDHPDTTLELKKLNGARNFLQNNGVFDNSSFFELINEQ